MAAGSRSFTTPQEKEIQDLMPVKDIRERRLAHKEKVKKYPVGQGRVYLQIIGTGAKGAPRALYVFTEQCSYLFNCGEGTQRLAYEHKVRLSKMEHILITHKSWENVGGLPGTLLTLQDTGIPYISIHGPHGVESLYFDTKGFMRISELNLNYHYCDTPGQFDEGPLIINHVPILPSKIKKQATGILEESTSLKDIAIVYICRPEPKPGALLPQACELAGVPKGPLLTKLKNGIDVTLPNGNIVKAKDVTKEDEPGAVFIVIEVPTQHYLPSLLKAKEFEKFQEKTANKASDIAQIIIHFSPTEVIAHKTYQLWISRFPSTTSHLYLNDKNLCMGSERVHKIQYKLNHLYPESFPLLSDTGIPLKKYKFPSEDCDKKKKKKLLPNCDLNKSPSSVCHLLDITKNIISKELSNDNNIGNEISEANDEPYDVSTLLTYHIRPLKKFDFSSLLTLDADSYVKECYEVKTFHSAYQKVTKMIASIKNAISTELKKREYPNFLFLGTGSCIPNKTRNTSGIALNISDSTSVILDCGEGTYGQLVRFMGAVKTDKFLQNLKCIYVSHKHADHHVGLIRLLLAREKYFLKQYMKVPPLYLLAPPAIKNYLDCYDYHFESIKDLYTFIPNQNFNQQYELFDAKKSIDILDYLEIKNLETCLVFHCKDAYGVSIILNDGYKIVYSGDTTPCRKLVEIGFDCDLLIHEATMEDDLKEMAISKKHSTTSGALQIAADMNAKNVILTHFSQRYAKVPLLDDIPSNVCVAFDNMQVYLRDLPCLPYLYPAYVAMFSEDYDEMVEKTRKRKVKELKSSNETQKDKER